MNPLKSQEKVVSLMILGDAYAALKASAIGASELDSRLVKFAAKGLKFAAQWTEGTRVTDQDITRQYAVSLIQGASRNSTSTRLTRAILAYGEALREFSACQYRAANTYASTTFDLVRG